MRCCGVIIVSILTGACSAAPQSLSLSQDELAASIREVAFECGELIGATEIARESWQIRCSDAEVYVAFKGTSGDLCFEPIIVGDTDIPTAVVTPKPRCTGRRSLQL